MAAWKPRAGLALAGLAPLALFWRLLLRSGWIEGLGWWALAALSLAGLGLALERAPSGRGSAGLLVGSAAVTALGLGLTGSVVLAQTAGLLSLASAVLLWRSTPAARWSFALLQGLLVFTGLHYSALGWLTPLLALLPLTAALARWRWGLWLGGLLQALVAGAFVALWLQDPYL